jgi:ATP-dependent DNA helicase RecQ
MVCRPDGWRNRRARQGAIIEKVLAGANILALMPTGSGKSLCYQLLALLRGGAFPRFYAVGRTN